MKHDVPTSTKASSWIVSKVEYSEMTGKSDRKTLSAGLIGKTQGLSSAYTLLWRAVIAQSIVDIYGEEQHRNQVINWLKSKDFEEVCDHADVDSEQMRLQLASLCRLPCPLAKKYGKMLRDQIMLGVYTADMNPNGGQIVRLKPPAQG